MGCFDHIPKHGWKNCGESSVSTIPVNAVDVRLRPAAVSCEISDVIPLTNSVPEKIPFKAGDTAAKVVEPNGVPFGWLRGGNVSKVLAVMLSGIFG